MRIIAGSQKGRKLLVPKKANIRPTTDRTKSFIFDYLSERTISTKVLDLFAGSGNLGIEALSRGATEAVFVERDRHIAQFIRKNLVITHFTSQARIITEDVFKFIRKTADVYDLIFADPPYEQSLSIKLISEIEKNNILRLYGILVIEHSDIIEHSLFKFELIKEKKIGSTKISFFQNTGG